MTQRFESSWKKLSKAELEDMESLTRRDEDWPGQNINEDNFPNENFDWFDETIEPDQNIVEKPLPKSNMKETVGLPHESIPTGSLEVLEEEQVGYGNFQIPGREPKRVSILKMLHCLNNLQSYAVQNNINLSDKEGNPSYTISKSSKICESNFGPETIYWRTHRLTDDCDYFKILQRIAEELSFNYEFIIFNERSADNLFQCMVALSFGVNCYGSSTKLQGAREAAAKTCLEYLVMMIKCYPE